MQCFHSRDHPFSLYAKIFENFQTFSSCFLNIDTTSFSVLTINISNIHTDLQHILEHMKKIRHFITNNLHKLYTKTRTLAHICMKCLFYKERIQAPITIASTFCFEYNSVQALRKLVDDHSFCYHWWMRLKQNTILKSLLS